MSARRREARRTVRILVRFGRELQRLEVKAHEAADRAMRSYDAGRGRMTLEQAVEYWRARCRVGPWGLRALVPPGTTVDLAVEALLQAGRPREAAWIRFGAVAIAEGPAPGVVITRLYPWEDPLPVRAVPVPGRPDLRPVHVGAV